MNELTLARRTYIGTYTALADAASPALTEQPLLLLPPGNPEEVFCDAKVITLARFND